MTSPEPRRITVAVHPPYTLHIGPGVIRALPAWLRSGLPGARCALVTDENVARLHLPGVREAMEAAGLETSVFTIPAGEASKTRAVKERLEDQMIEARLGRDTAVVALGGGVVGDLAGFTAATYHRGVPCVQVPTTLLAMVDASVGGKTGVDHPRGKNLIGAFHQPAAVFADIDFLGTLPEREFRSGLAEVVKCGVIRDAALLDTLARDSGAVAARAPALLTGLVASACAIKAEVVAADEREGDLRRILNFGHTIGHALETLSGYALSHGEAVSIGMVAESRLAVRLGMLSREAAEAIEASLSGLGLPVRIPPDGGMTAWAILEAARRDKKARQGRIVCALPRALGAMARGPGGFGIPLEDVLAAEVLSTMHGGCSPA
ncbi:MAG TPA: 3-dehydroquinate synthase [Candidatus Polarisedimenticolia bacterium]|nr:3-dehydroquinate synthase [Candidatus Polarisedimenticolia bacterium]